MNARAPRRRRHALQVYQGTCTLLLDRSVLELSSAELQAAIDERPLLLVEFYAPWWCALLPHHTCQLAPAPTNLPRGGRSGHCKQLAPKFEAASERLKGVAALAAVDASAEKDVGASYDVTGYPTLLVFKKGKNLGKYTGKR